MNKRNNTSWHLEYQRKRYSSTLEKAFAFLGGKCIECDSQDDLQFDHKDRTTKTFNITRMLAKYSWKRIAEELVKCQLLCHSCHTTKTNREVYGKEPYV